MLAIIALYGALATVTLDESNTSSQTQNVDVANLNVGSTDASELVPASYPLQPSTRSYEKWIRLNVSANADTNTIDNMKGWISTGSNPQPDANGPTFKTNMREAAYDGAQVYDTSNGPQNTDRSATYDYTQNVATSEPSGANIGIGGALAGTITTTGYSDYIIIQAVVPSGSTIGNQVTFTFAYDEVA